MALLAVDSRITHCRLRGGTSTGYYGIFTLCYYLELTANRHAHLAGTTTSFEIWNVYGENDDNIMYTQQPFGSF